MEVVDSVLNLEREPRMLDVVRSALADATDVRIAVSFTRCSGLSLILDPLREVRRRGGTVRVLTSTYQCVTQPEALESLRRLADDGVQTRLQDGPTAFHTKLWWFRDATAGECWAGSSNLTKGGLDTNIEWNVRRRDAPTLRLTGDQFDGLWARDDVRALDPSSIRTYADRYARERRDRPDIAAESRSVLQPNEVQAAALDRLRALRADGARRAAVIAATGVGKTYLAAFDALAAGARRLLFVSHRIEHLTQALRAFRRVFGSSRTFGRVGGGLDEADADFVFATIQSVRGRPDFLSRPTDYLVIDEFHHVEASSYEVLRPLCERAFLLGMTATPERQDGKDILAWCDHRVAYEVRLPEAIDRGWLLPLHYFGLADETIDFADFPWRKLHEVEDRLSVEARAEYVFRCALELGFDGPKRATVGFCAGVRHAQFMRDAFRRYGRVAEAVDAKDDVIAREAVYRRLEDPRDPLEWLFVSDVLNEGVDIPALNSLLFLRPTDSSTLFLQQLGRGLRHFPGTEVLTVLDFVGHHRSAWLPIRALDAPAGEGRRVEPVPGVIVQPPRGCEIVLERRTREILSKIRRFSSRREECSAAYLRLRDELGRPPMPDDLAGRTDVPELASFRAAFGDWLTCQREHGDEPSFARGLPEAHPALGFLRAIERDWQQQRVTPYAIVWALAKGDVDGAAYREAFCAAYPHWRAEPAPLDDTKAWATVRAKLGDALTGARLRPDIVAALGTGLLAEVVGRIGHAMASDYATRHEGALSTPDALRLHGRYARAAVVRHFGARYDPTRHNVGILWFGEEGVIVTKLDTSTAKTAHQYENSIESPHVFRWTSQNRMAPDEPSGRKVLDHATQGRTLRLFVQARSNTDAIYLGRVRCVGAEGERPMLVRLSLEHPVPDDVIRELAGAAERA